MLNHPGASGYDPKRRTAMRYMEEEEFDGIYLRSRAILNDPGVTRMVVLRDPVRRVVSAYLDKIAKPKRWRHSESMVLVRELRSTLGVSVEPAEVSFAMYLRYLEHVPNWRRDRHVQLQTRMIGSHTFDYYGTVEDMVAVEQFLEGRGFRMFNRSEANPAVFKATPYGDHESANRASALTPAQLAEYSEYPPAEVFMSAETLERIGRIYAHDVIAYCRVTGESTVEFWRRYGA